MRTRLFLGICGLIVCASACGGSGSTPTAPTSTQPPAAPTVPVTASGDNWSFRFDGLTDVGITGGYGGAAALAALEGSFDASPGSVSAVMQPFGRCLRGDTVRLSFTGTRSGNQIEMQSNPVAGQVVRITGALSAGDHTLQGTYTITGGCGSGTAGTMTGRRVELTGVWVGSIGSVPTTFDLQMAKAPDEQGNYVVSGAVKFSNTPCFPTAVLTRRARGRILFPDVVGDTQRLELIAEVTEDLSTMHLTSVLVAGTCPELSFNSGRLVRQ